MCRISSIKIKKFFQNTVTRLTLETLAPRHNPVDMPPQPL